MTGTIVVLLGLLSSASHAQDSRLLADCAVPQPVGQGGAEPAALTCDIRVTNGVAIKGAKATVKGRTDSLEATYTPFDPRNKMLVAMFLIQISVSESEPNRRGNVVLMADTVVRIADVGDRKRRFAAYTIAKDLGLVADFSATKADFDQQVRAIRGVTQPSQLYKTTLEAIAKLAKEPGDRKALVILGDGNSEDANHDQVVKAAKDAGIAIHALGYLADEADLPKFQVLQRLADETGGFRREVRAGGVQKYVVGNQFVGEVLENGGTLKLTFKEQPGPITVTITADLANGRSESVDHTLTMTAPPNNPMPWWPSQSTSQSPGVPPGEPAAWHQRLSSWVGANMVLASVIGLALVAGGGGLAMLILGSIRARAPAVDEGPQVVYGWLDTEDGDASRYPLRTTNIRIGRHRDNDICLQNDSISRRHAVLHFDSDNRRFVITDLGGDNGVIVNKIKQQSHELNDGDLVELGEVRLRFRTNMEHVG